MTRIIPFAKLIGQRVYSVAKNLSVTVVPKCEIVERPEETIIYQLSLDTMISNDSLFVNGEEILK